jgi:uncharacterized protein involved in exopolysaccharide biosynthesis
LLDEASDAWICSAAPKAIDDDRTDARNRMTESQWQDGEDVSLFAIGTTLLRSRWRIVRWMVAGAALGLLTAFFKPATYAASGSIVPQGGDSNRSSLASLAGQFGVTIPVTNQSVSPEFYATLLKSRVLLQPIANDTFTVPELGGRRVGFTELFDIKGSSRANREENAMKLLKKIIVVSSNKSTGIVEVSTSTEWRSVSLAIVTALLNGVNDYNGRTRQGQAAAERKFIAQRLAVADDDLRAAESRLADFLRSNRDIGSPQLTLQRERFQRELALRQQVYVSLTQSYEDARIREVRDIPVVSTFEPPYASTEPASRGSVIRLVLGLIIGALLGIAVSLVSAFIARRRADGDAEASEFFATLDEVKSRTVGRVARLSTTGRS